METSLHQQLKDHYAGKVGETEVRLNNYRIDVVRRGRLIEIQHGSLAAIRPKIKKLRDDHRITVVKPLVAKKYLIKRSAKGKEVTDRRLSPKRVGLLDIFDELIYFRDVFPHKNLVLEIPMVHIEEWRFPGHGKRRRWSKKDFQVEDQKLIEIEKTYKFRKLAHLTSLIPRSIPKPFHTGDLAASLKIDRRFAQRIAYCLREMNAIEITGKNGNALLYDFC